MAVLAICIVTCLGHALVYTALATTSKPSPSPAPLLIFSARKVCSIRSPLAITQLGSIISSPPPPPPRQNSSPRPPSTNHIPYHHHHSQALPKLTSHSYYLAKFVMAEVDYNRKRSRSPSDSDEKKHHKRANTGATASPDDLRAQKTQDSGPPSHPSMTHDVNMTEGPASIADTTASTPSPKPSSSDNKSGDSRSRLDEPSRSHATTSAAPSSSTAPSAMIHMRCLIVTQDASIIIGKGGSHVNEIRDKSGARVMVSESIPGNPERILNVSGPLDAVSKACT